MAAQQLVPIISKKVVIDGEIFSLEIVPKASTQLVKKETDTLYADLDLPGLVGDLLKLGTFARVAYYGVAGSTELQIKVQKVGFTVAKLCQESDITLVLYKKTCTEVIETLQSTYEYLVDGFEDVAVDNLKGMAEVAEKMAVASDKLKIEFEKAKHQVEECLTDTMSEKGKQEREKRAIEKMKKEEATKAEQEWIKKAAAIKMEGMKTAHYSLVEIKQKLAEEYLDEVLHANRERSVFDRIFRSLNGEISHKRDLFKEARRERLETLKEIDRQQNAKLQATLELKNCVLRMQQCKVEEGLAESAIEALHGAQHALKAITVIMMQASKFWRLMYEHCKQMGSEKMVAKIEKQMDKPEEKRLTFWGSTPFIMEAVKCYAKWVALQNVCTTYRDQIRGVEAQLYIYLKENPTTEEARKLLPEMAQALAKDLDKCIAKLKSDAIENKKEIEVEASKETDDGEVGSD